MNLNLTNRPVRTRTTGGGRVGGGDPAPYADQRFAGLGGMYEEENDATSLEGAALVETDKLAFTSRLNGGDTSLVADHVRRARAGDQEAFPWLVERFERMVFRTAVGLLGSLDDARDAAQETFLRMHRHLHRFDESRDLGPWLYRIVVNVAHDIARRRTRAPQLPLDRTVDKPDRTARFGPQEIEDAVERSEQRQLVRAALATLPEKERAAIVLRDIEGLTTAEVARALRSSEGTVRSQVCSARLKIRAFIDRERCR